MMQVMVARWSIGVVMGGGLLGGMMSPGMAQVVPLQQLTVERPVSSSPVKPPVKSPKLKPVQRWVPKLRPKQIQPQLSPSLKQFHRFTKRIHGMWLGDTRGACGYYIDMKAVYETLGNRFTVAKRSRGKFGTACRGGLEFRPLMVNCKAGKIFEVVRQPGKAWQRGWERNELILYHPGQRGRLYSKASARRICELPAYLF